MFSLRLKTEKCRRSWHICEENPIKSKYTQFMAFENLFNVSYIQFVMAQYGRAQYWEERYSRDTEHFDWYQRYFSIRDIIGEFVPVENRILNVGSGNSRLSEEMFDDGYENITNIDISQTSIKTMTEKFKDKGPNFTYIQMDVRAMEEKYNSAFEAVIDKGTFDSVVCGQGSGTNANKMLSEIYRVLTPGGIYIMISFGPKESRLQYLEKSDFDWGIKIKELPKPTITTTITEPDPNKPERNCHYAYICGKGKKQEWLEQEAKQKEEALKEVPPPPPVEATKKKK